MSDSQALDALGHIGELCHRYQITSLDGFRESCAAFAEEGRPTLPFLAVLRQARAVF